MARSNLRIYRAVLLWMVLDTAHGQTITGAGTFVVGQNKSLICSIVSGAQVDPNAPFPLSWPINATKVVSVQEHNKTDGQISTYSSTLTFTVDVKDNLVPFTCSARFIGTETTDSWVLYVIKPPNKPVVTGPTEVIGDRNSSWKCVVDGGSTGDPNVFWQFRNGSRIMSNNVLSANVFTDENQLEIHNVTAVMTLRVPAGNPSFDLGCVYVHSASSTQDTTYISINVTYLPRVDSGNSNITRHEKESVTIPCNFTAVPPVTVVTWLWDNNVMNVSLPLNKYGGGNLTKPALTILDLRSTDVGMYKCKVTNNIGSAESRSVNLIVECESLT